MVTINQRQFSCSLPLDEELKFEPNHQYVCKLPNYAALEVAGEKALDFLQGQLTCNLLEINEHTMRRAAQCNLKGRILAFMNVVLWNKRLFLILPRDLLEATRLSLAKPAMFSRVSLIPQEIAVYGLFSQKETSDGLPFSMQPSTQYGVCATEKHCCYRLTDSLSIFLTYEPETVFPEPPTNTTLWNYRGDLAWHSLLLKAGISSIYPSSRGLFLPHHLGLHKTNMISFEKGCYKGQEIIARMHYRAKIKHISKLILVDNHTGTFFPGQKIFDEAAQHEIGEVIDTCPYVENQSLLLITTSKPETSTVYFEQHPQKSTISFIFD